MLIAAAIFACRDGATNPTDDRLNLATTGNPGAADVGEVELCKWGTLTLFRVTIDGAKQPRSFQGPDECTVLATSVGLGPGNHTVTVIEDRLQGTVFDSIVAESVTVRNPTPVRSAPITSTREITVVFNGDNGWLINYYNH